MCVNLGLATVGCMDYVGGTSMPAGYSFFKITHALQKSNDPLLNSDLPLALKNTTNQKVAQS